VGKIEPAAAPVPPPALPPSPDQAAAPEQAQVFISYTSADAEKVLAIARQLEEAGIKVWRDGDRILGGQYYGEQIVHALAHSKAVLLMCSPEAFRSDNVHREVLLTWDYYHRTYLPIWISPPGEIPDRFRYCLVGCQWMETHGKPAEQWLPRVVEALKSLGVRPSGADTGTAAKGTTQGGVRRGARFAVGDRPIPGTDWQLVQLLGKGGYGEVWKAHNPELPSLPPVALKFCLELDERGKELLRHEANMVLRAQRGARNDGIVPLAHAYLTNDPPCLEYPYVEGGTLVRLIDEGRAAGAALSQAQARRIVQRVAAIVGAAHRATPKLVHRDLKPSNILVARRPDRKLVIRVTDFGIGGVVAQPALERSRSANSLQGEMAAVLTGAYTPLYASPQQVRGSKPDPRDDVYALGVIWYQLLTGDLANPAPTGRMWMKALSHQGMSDVALDLLAACIESDPAARPADAAELADRLQALPAAESSGEVLSAVLVPEDEEVLPTVEPVAERVVTPVGAPETSGKKASDTRRRPKDLPATGGRPRQPSPAGGDYDPQDEGQPRQPSDSRRSASGTLLWTLAGTSLAAALLSLLLLLFGTFSGDHYFTGSQGWCLLFGLLFDLTALACGIPAWRIGRPEPRRSRDVSRRAGAGRGRPPSQNLALAGVVLAALLAPLLLPCGCLGGLGTIIPSPESTALDDFKPPAPDRDLKP
jgi:serine/threonine protein kinase